ncbi:uncharacterized protein LOC120013751 [Tripterygium wilfordii]|uniref:uncharacterized protein LOC120013751 n=1 Tax=Tripterygium wilfordii TaxID=458696 RepID=UPI0018F80195|nr:uncharacterized protein LOC120013751 [Tripterygium wilfordii]
MKQQGMSVTDYYAKMKTLWDELKEYHAIPTIKCTQCTLDILKPIMDKKNKEKVMQFLMGLNDSYSAIVSQILLQDPFPDINKAFNLVRQEERKQKLTEKSPSISQEAMAMAVQNFQSFQNNGASKSFNKSNAPKRNADGNQKSTQNTKEGLFCNYCKMTNHTIDKCFRIHGYPNPPNNNTSNTKKFKHTNSNYKSGKAHANQVTTETEHKPTLEFSADQCQQILQFLQNQGHQSNGSQGIQSQAASVSGHSHFGEDWLGNGA